MEAHGVVADGLDTSGRYPPQGEPPDRSDEDLDGGREPAHGLRDDKDVLSSMDDDAHSRRDALDSVSGERP